MIAWRTVSEMTYNVERDVKPHWYTTGGLQATFGPQRVVIGPRRPRENIKNMTYEIICLVYYSFIVLLSCFLCTCIKWNTPLTSVIVMQYIYTYVLYLH